MTRMRLVGPVLVLTVLAARPAAAQLCTGSPSFAYASYQASLGASFSNGVRGVDAGVAGGSQTIFGGGGVTVLNFTDIDVKTVGAFGFAGAELATDRDNKILLCPLVRLDVIPGPDIGPVNVSTTAFQGGGSVGLVASDTGDMLVVPFLGVALVYSHLKSEFAGDETTFNDTGGRIDVGVGLIFNRTAGITPSVSIPFGTGGADTTFSIKFAYHFGRR